MKVFGRIVAAVSALVCIFGGIGVYEGWKEGKLAAKSTPDPVAVDLAKIEAGEKPATNYLKIGPHYAYYNGLVYWEESKHGIKSIKYSYYPIVSPSHPDADALKDVTKKNNGTLGSPGTEPVPDVKNFVVLVKTSHYKSEADLNNLKPVVFIDGSQGMVINDIESLKDEEKKLIHDQFPQFDANKILIFELDRKPMSAATAQLMMFAGIGGLVLGAVGFLGGMFLRMRN
jgi:hypothetical protein